MWIGRRAGQFNSCSDYDADGGLRICGEGFAGWLWREVAFSDGGENGVPDVGERDGRGAGSDAAGVFLERSVANAEEAVLDLPMVAGELEQRGLVHHGLGDGGDGVDHLP